jgi:hypothetical protein
VTIEGGRALKGEAGQIVPFRVVLANDDGSTTTVPAKVKFPGSAAGKLGTVKLIGQIMDEVPEEEEEIEVPYGDLDQLLAYYEAQTSSDQLSGMLNVGGKRISFTSSSADKQIFGSIRVPVRVLAR